MAYQDLRLPLFSIIINLDRSAKTTTMNVFLCVTRRRGELTGDGVEEKHKPVTSEEFHSRWPCDRCGYFINVIKNHHHLSCAIFTQNLDLFCWFFSLSFFLFHSQSSTTLFFDFLHTKNSYFQLWVKSCKFHLCLVFFSILQIVFELTCGRQTRNSSTFTWALPIKSLNCNGALKITAALFISDLIAVLLIHQIRCSLQHTKISTWQTFKITFFYLLHFFSSFSKPLLFAQSSSSKTALQLDVLYEKQNKSKITRRSC